MKKVLVLLLVLLLVVLMISSSFAAGKCSAVLTNHQRCNSEIVDKSSTSVTYNGYHYVKDNYGWQESCHYSYNYITKWRECKRYGHLAGTGTKYTNSFGHDNPLCSNYGH